MNDFKICDITQAFKEHLEMVFDYNGIDCEISTEGRTDKFYPVDKFLRARDLMQAKDMMENDELDNDWTVFYKLSFHIMNYIKKEGIEKIIGLEFTLKSDEKKGTFPSHDPLLLYFDSNIFSDKCKLCHNSSF